MIADKNIFQPSREISVFPLITLTHTYTYIYDALVSPLSQWVNFSQGSTVITSSVVHSAAVRWPTERSISVFTDLIQCGIFKLAGQGEIRLYLLGMDFCLVKAARARGRQGVEVWFTRPDSHLGALHTYPGNQRELPSIDYSIFSQIMLFSSLLKVLTGY